MKKYLVIFGMVCFLSSCSFFREEIYDPDYNYIADHVVIIEKSPWHVVYEYSNIRIDEIAPVAAIYCANRGDRQAVLYDIKLQPDNRRRATFVCDELPSS